MSGWGSGYVTDITYTTGWHRQQSPAVIAIACMLGGVASPMPAGDDPVTYLELGCGHGLGALLLAASNPAWQVTAIDFNPAHIASARAFAREAGLANISFIEADFVTLAESPAAAAIPMADFVSLHGVWSWVPPSVQQGVVRLLRDKVQPGGAVHLSYNALPGWSTALGMQRLLRAAGRQHAGRSDRQAEEGLKFIRDLVAADALQLRHSHVVEGMLKRLDVLPSAYLAHEYMNEGWAPCFVTDVAAAFAEAKLEWVASANLIENFPELTLTAQQRPLMRQFDDPVLRELVKDHCMERMLRHDVFVRGARRLSPRQRDAALQELWINLNIRPQDLPLETDMPAGKAELNPRFYQPIVRALEDGPKRVGDLLRLPDVEGNRDNPAELVGILVGGELAEPALRPLAAPTATAQRFNRTAARQLWQSEPIQRSVAAASYRLGTGTPATVLELVVQERVVAGAGGLDELVRHFATMGAVTDEAKLRGVLATCLETHLPRLRAAGVL